MNSFALALSLILVSGSVQAADSPRCIPLDRAQKAAGAHTAVAPLTAAQFHFLQGVYVLNPSTPDGLPPGDGALLLTWDGEKDGLILWTRGPLACAPMAAPAKLIKYLKAVKAGAVGDGDPT